MGNYNAGRALAARGEAGIDAGLASRWADYTRRLGIAPAASRALAEMFMESLLRQRERQSRPPREQDPAIADAEAEQRTIISDRASPYYNREHRRHRATVERVHQLAKIITKGGTR